MRHPDQPERDDARPVALPKRSASKRRAQILQAAVEVIIERGLADTRIADIAERAGASPALVIYHFGTRDQVLAQALAYSEDRFYGEIEQELAGIDSPTEQLARLIEASCSSGSGGPGDLDEWVLWLDLWARAPRDPEVARDREALDRRWRRTIAAVVRRGIDAGEFSAVDPDDFTLRLSALMDGLAVQVTLGDPDVHPDRMYELCMRTAANELRFAWDLATRPRRPAQPRRRAAELAEDHAEVGP